MRQHSQITKLPKEPHQAAIARYAREGAYIAGDDVSAPWVPFGPNAAIKHLCFDVRTNSVANVLWVKGGGRIGTHKHRGVVSAITLEGSWGYYEYDWTARPGDFVYELPGTAHTLYSDDPNGMKALFWINGAVEFYDDAGVFDFTMDVFWFINHYTTFCSENGLDVNKSMFI
ncbi:2,4'-dihydroxyacetophenone dioxygenase family protein [Bradyrhizobium tropiciagri]|uniref:2,4'-dihydroxyacetophenone dioxygenase family protein n=1 Tax=Bradyrhizobium tropiciagri TaxID=312253 RepID=UPI001BA95EA0|nr:2,4'-dihydroxyacetophenone dioxygenase family protein [Bradyrhizobium tropiciagri]MBR0899187.1 2,4'-dihydroxyacetophenone dioxygenase family protein [Bradyrhizobium tropiciagri]